MRLVPYGAGWMDVYADFGDGELYFIISTSLSNDNFETLLKALYYLYPETNDTEYSEFADCKEGICIHTENGYVVDRIVDRVDNDDMPCIVRSIPWRTSFSWNEEGSESVWTFEREPTENTEFNVKVTIDIHRDEDKHYEYTVPYEDLCYAVCNAYTKALKKHGFWGYHHVAYESDINLRYFLLLKCIALRNFEARKLTFYDEKGKGETSDFEKELELVLFDM